MSKLNLARLYFNEGDIAGARSWYKRAIISLNEIESLEPSLENKEALEIR